MSNNLVILESPGKIGAVKSYLGSKYKVIASIGHVRDLPKSTLGIDIENAVLSFLIEAGYHFQNFFRQSAAEGCQGDNKQQGSLALGQGD